MQQRPAFVWLVFALLFGSATSVAAQDAGATHDHIRATHDSAEAGREAGAAAARRHPVGGYFAAGLLSGLPIGAAAPIAVGEAHPDVPPMVITAAGVAGVVGISVHAAHAGVTLPATDETWLHEHSAAYQHAFRDAYTIQIQHRRERAALWGGLTGTALGLGAVLLLLTHIDT